MSWEHSHHEDQRDYPSHLPHHSIHPSMFPSLNQPFRQPQSLTASKPRQHLPPPPSPLVPTTFLRTLALLLPRTRTPLGRPDRAHPLRLPRARFSSACYLLFQHAENNICPPLTQRSQMHAVTRQESLSQQHQRHDPPMSLSGGD